MDYSKIYDKLYKKGYHGDYSYSHAKNLCRILEKKYEFKSILDVGCSHGWAVSYFQLLNKEAYGIDCSFEAIKMCDFRQVNAYMGQAHELPFNDNEVDVVMSTETFEHIAPEHVDKAISEACRVASKFIAMQICTRLDREEWKNEVNMNALHLTVESTEWWIEKFQQHGFELDCRYDEIFIMKTVKGQDEKDK